MKEQNRVKWLLLIILLTLPLWVTFSQDVSTDLTDVYQLDINTAVDMAVENNLNFKNNQLDLKNKLLSVSTSWNEFLPKINSSLSINNSNGSSTVGISLGTSLSISADNILNVITRYRQYQTEELTYAQAKQQLTIEVKKVYYQLVLLNQEWQLKQEELDNAKIVYDTALIKYQGHVISEIEKLKSEYTYKSLVPELEKLKNDYFYSENVFKQMIGMDPEQQIAFVTVIPELLSIDEQALEQELMNSNLDLKLLNQELRETIQSRNSQIFSFIPSFSVAYSLPLMSYSSINGGIEDLSQQWSNTRPGLSFALSLDSLIPFSTVQTGIITAQNNIRKVQNTIRNETENKIVDLQRIMASIKELEQTIELYQLNIEITDKTYRMVKTLYDRGNSSYLELKDAEADRSDAQFKLLNARFEYLTNLFELESLLSREIIR